VVLYAEFADLFEGTILRASTRNQAFGDSFLMMGNAALIPSIFNLEKIKKIIACLCKATSRRIKPFTGIQTLDINKKLTKTFPDSCLQ